MVSKLTLSRSHLLKTGAYCALFVCSLVLTGHRPFSSLLIVASFHWYTWFRMHLPMHDPLFYSLWAKVGGAHMPVNSDPKVPFLADFCQGIFGRFCTHSDRVGPFLAGSVSMRIVVVSQKKVVGSDSNFGGFCTHIDQ